MPFFSEMVIPAIGAESTLFIERMPAAKIPTRSIVSARIKSAAITGDTPFSLLPHIQTIVHSISSLYHILLCEGIIFYPGKIYNCNIQITVNLYFCNTMLPGCIQEYR